MIEEKIKRNKKKTAPTNWSMINNSRTINLLEGLLRGESISQLKNNYGFSKITNPIAEIRNEIGFDLIENYRIKGLRCEEYRLVKNSIAEQKVKALQQKILEHIKDI